MPDHITPKPGDTLADLDDRVTDLYDGTFFPKPSPEMEMADPTVDKVCIMCDKPGNKLCDGGCRTRYCCKKCEQADKITHELICGTLRELASARAEKAEASGDVLVLVFQQADWDILRMLNKNRLLREYAATRQKLQNLDPNYEEGKPAAFEIIINSCVPWRRAGHGLYYHGKLGQRAPDMTCPSHKPNTAIMQLSPSGTAYQMYERVEIFAYNRVHPEGKPSYIQIEDVTARDFRTVVDFFQTMKANSCIPDPERFPASFYGCEIWQGVKLNSRCEVAVYRNYKGPGSTGKGLYHLADVQDVAVPSIPLNGMPRQRAMWPHLLGLNWFVQSPYGIEGGEHWDGRNVSARWFGTKTGTELGTQVGNVPMCAPLVNNFGGTVIVTHKHGAPVHPLHVIWLVLLLDDAKDDQLEMPFEQWYWHLRELSLLEWWDVDADDVDDSNDGHSDGAESGPVEEHSKEDEITGAMAEMSLQNEPGEEEHTDVKPTAITEPEEEESVCASTIPRPTLRDGFRARWAAWIQRHSEAQGYDASGIPCPYDAEPA